MVLDRTSPPKPSRRDTPPDEIALLRAWRIDAAHHDSLRERSVIASNDVVIAAMRG
jgi:hypothetical protein